ncbi:MAG: SGNH/GDSL hydrolase family protein [Ferruginibacter sp.]|nr:SGNH/GDSL hydrolase family protein [Ferruginibacter sp.]
MCKCLIFLLLITFNATAQLLPAEFNARKGLPNIAWKLTHKQNTTLTVAFLGGSITEAANGWRDKTFNWLQQQYPMVTFKQINAAIGGTGSELGVYRIDDQVLKHKPDLLFVEFAVNDFDFSRTSILKSMEGIVRKTFAANSKTDICFVYTITENIYNLYKNDSMPLSIKTMEEVAGYYKIPSVNVGVNIFKLLNEKKLFMKGLNPVSGDSSFFSGDGTHPYPETGHQQYFNIMSNFLKQMFLRPAISNHLQRKPFYSDSLDNSGMMDVQPSMLKGNIQSIKYYPGDIGEKFSASMPNMMLLNDTAQEISFSFTGNRIGFMDVLAPSSAQLTVLIDNHAPRLINRFDKYCFYFSRMHWFFIDGLTNGKHLIRIKLSTVQPDKFLLLDKERSTLEKPEEYGKFIWRVGKILKQM